MNAIDRLITFFTPEHYGLSMTLERTKRMFSGTVTITGELHEGASAIKLHAKGLSIVSATIDGTLAEIGLSDDELSLSYRDLAPGKHIVVITFDGTITDPMHGLYTG